MMTVQAVPLSRHEWLSHSTASACIPLTPHSTIPDHMPRSMWAVSGRSVTSGRKGHVGDHRHVTVHALQRRLKPKRADCGADALQAVLQPRRRLQPGGTYEIAAEALARPPQRFLPPLCR
jgi:hypothetical protein